MTSDTVIEQAAKAMHATVCCPCDPQGCDVSEVAELDYAHALADAGLLADPADRDEEGLQTRLDISVIAAKTFRARAERAEAERDELRATVERYESECNCGYGGFHEPLNPRCERNQ